MLYTRVNGVLIANNDLAGNAYVNENGDPLDDELETLKANLTVRMKAAQASERHSLLANIAQKGKEGGEEGGEEGGQDVRD